MLSSYLLITLNLGLALGGTLLAKGRYKRTVAVLIVTTSIVSIWQEFARQQPAAAAAEREARLATEMLQGEHMVIDLMLLFDLKHVSEDDDVVAPADGVFPLPTLVVGGDGSRFRLHVDLAPDLQSMVTVVDRGSGEYDVHVDDFRSYSIPSVGTDEQTAVHAWQFDQEFAGPSSSYFLRLPVGPPHLPESMTVPRLLTLLTKERTVGYLEVDTRPSTDATANVDQLASLDKLAKIEKLWKDNVRIAFRADISDNGAPSDLPFTPHIDVAVTLEKQVTGSALARFDLVVAGNPRLFFEETTPF